MSKPSREAHLPTRPLRFLLLATLLVGCRDATAPIPGAAQAAPAGEMPANLPPQLPGPGQSPGLAPPGMSPPQGPGAQAAAPLPPPEVRIAQIQVASVPPTMHASPASFGGGAVRYLGYEVEPAEPQLGQKFRITHYWQAQKPIPQDWTIFVHFGVPGQPGNVANADHVPAAGAYPSSKWKPGAIFRDDQLFALPPNFPQQQLEMYVGLYQGDDRMPLDQPGLGAENRLLVTTLKFAPNTGPSNAPGPGTIGANAPLPTYKASRAKGPIHIDGVLDEADWKNAPSTGPFVRSIDGGKTHFKTEAKLLYDDQFLYIAFTCEDEDVWSDFTKHDDKLYTQEAVELFVDADGDGKTYNELEIAPTNATFDAYFPARRQGMDLSWESGMISAVKVQGTLNDPTDVDKGWVAEAKIPLKSFAAVPHLPLRPGDKWRFNLYRLDWQQNRKVNEGSAFSPLFQGDFHNLPRFGWLEFGS